VIRARRPVRVLRTLDTLAHCIQKHVENFCGVIADWAAAFGNIGVPIMKRPGGRHRDCWTRCHAHVPDRQRMESGT
jgi:hypothetical protein